MTPDAPPLDPILCRRALEALRAGVPNRDVARLLVPLHGRATAEFDTLLRDTENSWDTKRAARGFVVSGGFGAGKSHLLEYLQHRALESNFICSRVVLSKETPLGDLTKLFRACVQAASAPGRTGAVLNEIAETLDIDRAPSYPDFYSWVHENQKLDPRLAATVFLFDRQARSDPELREKLLGEWNGFPMLTRELKAAVKAAGDDGSKAYVIGRAARGAEYHRFEFLTRFFRAAGYNGWVILLDEMELVARYSLRQRGKSYAHLAMLLGAVESARVPGLAVVGAVTDDYAGEVLRRRHDIEKVPERMRLANDPNTSEAELGMSLIETGSIPLAIPSKKQIEDTFEQLRAIYAAAYRWEPPASLANTPEYAGSTRMRQYVRAWINLWDLRRLYNYGATTVIEKVVVSYDEDADLAAGSGDADTAAQGEE